MANQRKNHYYVLVMSHQGLKEFEWKYNEEVEENEK